MRRVLEALPWLCYAALAWAGKPGLGGGTALGVWALLHARTWKTRPELERTFGLFFGSVGILELLSPETARLHAGTLLFALLGGMSLLTLLRGKPFVLRYARKDIAESHWEHPHFKRVVHLVAWVWTLCFFLGAGVSAYFGPVLAPKTWPVWIMTGSCLGAAALFTFLFPKWYRRHVFALPLARH